MTRVGVITINGKGQKYCAHARKGLTGSKKYGGENSTAARGQATTGGTSAGRVHHYLMLSIEIVHNKSQYTPVQVEELNLDNVCAAQISGLTQDFTSLKHLSIINTGLTTLDTFPALRGLERVGDCVHMSGTTCMTPTHTTSHTTSQHSHYTARVRGQQALG